MPTDAAFRLSLYLTLSLACACIGYAEHDLFPEVPVIAGIAIISLVVLYRLETRVELLSIPDANRLGLIVGLLNFAWAAFRVAQSIRRPTPGQTELQLVLVALFGLMLITLIPAKLARREKHIGDYWGFHALALVAASLSGAMARDATCFVLIGLYAIAAVWSLSLLHLRRAAGVVASIPNRAASPPVVGVLSADVPRSGVRRALGFCLFAIALAVPLYLVTPRSPGDRLDFGKPRVEIGYSAAQMIDLNQSGTLEENPAPAFEVTVISEGGTPPVLPSEQRWRGATPRRYAKGVWEVSTTSLPGIEETAHTTLPWSPPHLAPGQVTLKFNVPTSLPAQVLAEPVLWARGQAAPVATLTAGGPQPWSWIGDGSLYWSGRLQVGGLHQYLQIWNPQATPDLSPPFHLVDLDPSAKLRPLLQGPVLRVKEYADTLLNRLVDAGQLPKDCRNPVTLLPRSEYHERVARAFSNHLATSPEFTYTTDIRRTQKDLDPVEEFLFHTQSGHCERFAAALTLMLRSQGIPAVLVLGFKGWEQSDEPNRYIVKQEHAHAWVDALIVEYEPAPKRFGRPISRWLTLDPTPNGQPASIARPDGWAAEMHAWFRDIFRDYITNYSPEKRRQALAAIGRWLQRPDVLGALAAIVAAIVFGKRLRRRVGNVVAQSPPSPESAFLNRLLVVLSAHGFTLQPGETPREFAVRVSDALRENVATASVANVPGNWTEAYYEVRFGERELSPERLASLETSLSELGQTLVNLRGKT